MNKALAAIALMAVLVFLSGTVLAAVPQLITFQGKLQSGGADVNSTVDMVFKIYRVSSAGTALWTESHTSANAVTVSNGVFSTTLGSITALDLNFAEDYWIGVAIGSDSEMTPRLRLTSSPYSYTSSTIDGNTSVYYTNASNINTGSIGAPFLPQTDLNAWYVKQVDGNTWYLLESDGNLMYYKQVDANAVFAKISDINGTYARTTDINTAFARILDVNGLFPVKDANLQTDFNSVFSKQSDANNAFAKTSDVNGLFPLSDANLSTISTVGKVAVAAVSAGTFAAGSWIFPAGATVDFLNALQDGNIASLAFSKLTGVPTAFPYGTPVGDSNLQTDFNSTFVKISDSNNKARLSSVSVRDWNTTSSITWATIADPSTAPTDATYVTLSTNGTLSAERVLTGTSNQITVTDNGAGSTVVLSTPQNLHTAADPTFDQLTLTNTLVVPNITNTSAITTGSIDSNDFSLREAHVANSAALSGTPELNWLMMGFYGDAFQFKGATNLEYYDGATWQVWNDTDTNNAFDGSNFTSWSTPADHNRFRFVVNSGNFNEAGLFGIFAQTSAVIDINIESSEDSLTWTQRAVYTDIPSNKKYLMLAVDYAGGDDYWRVDINSTGANTFQRIVMLSMRGMSFDNQNSVIRNDYSKNIALQAGVQIGTATPPTTAGLGVGTAPLDSGGIAANGDINFSGPVKTTSKVFLTGISNVSTGNALYYNSTTGEVSWEVAPVTPFLYDDKNNFLFEVLAGYNEGIEVTARQRVPKDSKYFVLSEEKHEEAFFDYIALAVRCYKGNTTSFVAEYPEKSIKSLKEKDGTYLSLKQGDKYKLEFEKPSYFKECDSTDHVLVSTGYYENYDNDWNPITQEAIVYNDK